MENENVRKYKYIISSEFNNRTLLDFLKSIGYSRNIITHIKNTTNIDIYQIVHTDDEVVIDIVEVESSKNVCPIEMPLSIIYEDDDMVVVNKPSDMPTHPSKGNVENTLGNALAYYYKGSNFVYRPINRLDKDTSGIVIVAKNILSASYLSSMITTNQLFKTYIGICDGNVYNILYKTGFPSNTKKRDLSRSINFSFEANLPISREEGPSIKRVINPFEGERAITKVNVLSYDKTKNLSICKFHLYTGRTHQIRVHMQHLGYPLIGDFLYNPNYTYINRQALHCNEVILLHPFSATLIRLDAPLPADMRKILNN